MSVSCEQFVELVTEYLEGVMDSESKQRFEEHLALCPGCVTYLDQIRETIRLAGRVQAEDLSMAARQHLLQAFNDWTSP
jgi:predicted anti-sigma-YlaC factor YlaD